jgi:L-fucose isomerase-like protein
MNKLNICLIKTSLPSYFPDKYDVWGKSLSELTKICRELNVNLKIIDEIPMNANDAKNALSKCEDVKADFVLILHGGFTMGDVALTFAESNFKLGFWSVPEPIRTGDIQLNNFVSLNMSMSIAKKVRDTQKYPIKWFHGNADSLEFIKKLSLTIKALKALKTLSNTRIGQIGGLAMTFYNMEVSSAKLKSKLGLNIINHDIHELTDKMSNQEVDKVEKEVKKMLSLAPTDNVSIEQLRLSAQASLSLRDISNENDYNALAVSDWPALQEKAGMHPGAAFSLLEEIDKIPVASEGDILGAVTQIVAKSFTDNVGYLLDMTEPDLENGKLLMWHGGGGPLYLADKNGAKWVNHPMIGRGTPEGPIFGSISDLVFQSGPVTVFRISDNAKKIFHMTAEIREVNPSGFTGCRGWLDSFKMNDTQISLNDLVSTVMEHGIEHHFVLVPGDITSELNELKFWSGMENLDPILDNI